MILLDAFTFLGRLHPMVVHLPLGFLVLAFLFRLGAHTEKYRHLDEGVPLILLAATVSAIAACVFGYLLSLNGDYDRVLLRNHKWMGIALAIASGFFYLLSTRRWVVLPDKVFTIGFTGLVLLMLYTGHHGGMLTHGGDYLTLRTLTKQQREKPKTLEDAYIYEDVVAPILEARCGQCHGGGKKKGGLSMETLESLLKGGKTGHGLVPGNALESELYKRVTLNPNDEKFMPANGKTPLKPQEVEIIRWWIDHAGAAEGQKLMAINGHDSIHHKVAVYLGLAPQEESAVGAITQKINPSIPATYDSLAVESLRQKGWMVRFMLHQPVMLDITKPSGSGGSISEAAADLSKLSKNIVWLNLSNNNLTDKDLSFLVSLSNLEKLRLDGNPVTDAVCESLKGLKHLEAVNVVGTGVTGRGYSVLTKGGNVERVYADEETPGH